jgi:hypothetical protein
MDVEINFIGVLAASIVSMVVGSIWYSKAVFGKIWVKLEKIDEKKAKKDAPSAISGMAVLAILMAYVLAHVTYLSSAFYTDYSYQGAALSSAFWMWVGFVLPVVASNSLFNQAPWKISAIHAGNWLVTLLGMGFVIGAIGL